MNIQSIHEQAFAMPLTSPAFPRGPLDNAAIAQGMASIPNFLLKIIPHVDGSVRICELERYYRRDVTVHDAWNGPAVLSLLPYALAPVADLPVLEILGAKHIVADLTLDLGAVVLDDLN